MVDSGKISNTRNGALPHFRGGGSKKVWEVGRRHVPWGCRIRVAMSELEPN